MSRIKKLLGQRIRDARKAKGLTQEQLAERLGIGTSNISYIETGKFAPSMENFEKLVEILGVEPSELYTFTTLKTAQEMKSELNNAFENDEMLKLIYKFYLSVKF